MAAPLIAAITGWGMSWIPSTMSSSNFPARCAITVGVNPSMCGIVPETF
ncbi:unannotated protein [freshwater metagenome]|uniref:Unannotated protein n=1 Tax=freshwater metagenome TaxID=449393 RepID=A0A6J6IQA5_9ZZZZ